MARTLASGGSIHFELAGLNVGEALAGDASTWVGRYTAWELQQVVASPALRGATTFYLDGVAQTAAQLSALGLWEIMNGRFELALQSGNWGYFGSVTVDVEIIPGSRGLAVDYSGIDNQWRSGLGFGLAYAYEKSVATMRGVPGARARVVEARGHIVDTTETVMAFVAAQAFFHAVEMPPPPGLGLDQAVGQFHFPK
jgi:hypothetical protein